MQRIRGALWQGQAGRSFASIRAGDWHLPAAIPRAAQG